MPSVFRFLVVLAVLAMLVYGAMWSLANFVTVTPRTMEQAIPPERLNR